MKLNKMKKKKWYNMRTINKAQGEIEALIT